MSRVEDRILSPAEAIDHMGGPAPEQRRGMTRRKVLLGLGAGGVAAAAIGAGVWRTQKNTGTPERSAPKDEIDVAIGERIEPEMRRVNAQVVAAHRSLQAQQPGQSRLRQVTDGQAGTVTFDGAVKRQLLDGLQGDDASESYNLRVVMGANQDGTPNPDDPRYVEMTHNIKMPGWPSLSTLIMETERKRPSGDSGPFAGYVADSSQSVTRFKTTDDRVPNASNNFDARPLDIADGTVLISSTMLPDLLSALRDPESQ